MKPAFMPDPMVKPTTWADIRGGDLFKQVVERAVHHQCRQFFGYYLLQLGELSCLLDVSVCPIRHKIQQSKVFGDNCRIQASSEALPYKENSIDAAIVSLELDFSRDPHQILRELDRVMIPEGKIMLVGFNPYSLFNLARLIPGSKRKLLRGARFFSSGRVTDWLHLLGYDIIAQKKSITSGFLFGQKAQRYSWLTAIAEKYCSAFGAIYIITAKKRESTLTPIKPAWRTRPKLASVVGLPAGQNNCPAKRTSPENPQH